MQHEEESLKDKKGAAKYLQASVPTVDRLRKTGALRSVKIGNLVRFKISDLVAFVDRNARGGE
jgi:excisionase family DNA binding protein